MTNHYEVVVKTSTHTFTVNVFTEGKDKEVIKELSIEETLKLQKELGIKRNMQDINPIGYKVIKPFI